MLDCRWIGPLQLLGYKAEPLRLGSRSGNLSIKLFRVQGEVRFLAASGGHFDLHRLLSRFAVPRFEGVFAGWEILDLKSAVLGAGGEKRMPHDGNIREHPWMNDGFETQ